MSQQRVLIDLHALARVYTNVTNLANVFEILQSAYCCDEQAREFQRKGSEIVYDSITYRDVFDLLRCIGISSDSCDVKYPIDKLNNFIRGGYHRDEYIRILSEFLSCKANIAWVCCHEPEEGCKYGIDCSELVRLLRKCCNDNDECVDIENVCTCVYKISKRRELPQEKVRKALSS